MRAALLYPFANLLEPGSGNSLRMSLLLNYLRENCEEVWTVSPAPAAGELRDGNIRHVFFAWPSWRRAYYFMRSKYLRLTRGLQYLVEQNILHLFADHQHSSELRRLLESVIPQCGIVFLKYPFWASTVIPLCNKYKIPCVITAIDVHAALIGRRPELKKMILDLELSALRSADYAFCVSEDDQRFFAQHGVQIQCIVNPIDVEQCSPERNTEKIGQLRTRYGLGDGPLSLFVGSRIVPNVEAVRIIRQIALQVPECQFVIAGRCARPGRDGNFVKLGFVDLETLQALYTAAKIVLMPLKTGTGTSLKFVEALAYGKVILASSVAARGYAVVPGRDALVVDDFSHYPDLIRDLLGNEEKCDALARGAKALAQNYDYRRVFQPYKVLLNSLRSEFMGAKV